LAVLGENQKVIQLAAGLDVVAHNPPAGFGNVEDGRAVRRQRQVGDPVLAAAAAVELDVEELEGPRRGVEADQLAIAMLVLDRLAMGGMDADDDAAGAVEGQVAVAAAG